MPETTTPTRITHLIGHEYWTGTAARTAPVFNPATGRQTGAVDLASKELVDEVAGASLARTYLTRPRRRGPRRP